MDALEALRALPPPAAAAFVPLVARPRPLGLR